RPDLIRLAAFARPKARPLGLRAGAMEADMAWLGVACRTGWPAIDAGGGHRVVKRPVGAAIASDDGRPARVLFRRLLAELAQGCVHGRCLSRSLHLLDR